MADETEKSFDDRLETLMGAVPMKTWQELVSAMAAAHAIDFCRADGQDPREYAMALKERGTEEFLNGKLTSRHHSVAVSILAILDAEDEGMTIEQKLDMTFTEIENDVNASGQQQGPDS